MVPTTKICNVCKIEKNLTEFHKSKMYRLGVTAQCKVCRLIAIKKWHKEHPENVKAAHLRYRKTDKCKALWKRARIKHAAYRKMVLERWRQNNPERIAYHALNRRLKQRGMTLAEYQFLLEKQNGVCAVCGQPEARGEQLAIDHCHVTNKNRGLLCERHNMMMGLAGDSPEILRKAADYLESWPLPT